MDSGTDDTQPAARIPTLIIVQGRPASGKSTLAVQLGVELGIACISNDGIKETLYDSFRRDREDDWWSRRLGAVSLDMLYHVTAAHLSAGQSLVIESNFDPALAKAKLQDFQSTWPFTVVQVVCQAEDAVLEERFEQRAESNERHPVHVDAPEAAAKAELFVTQSQPLDIPGQVIEVDTTDVDAIDLPAILAQVRAAMKLTEAAGGE